MITSGSGLIDHLGRSETERKTGWLLHREGFLQVTLGAADGTRGARMFSLLQETTSAFVTIYKMLLQLVLQGATFLPSVPSFQSLSPI